MKTEIIELIGMQGRAEFDHSLNDKIDSFKSHSSYSPIEFGHEGVSGLKEVIAEQYPQLIDVLQLNPIQIYTTAKEFNSFSCISSQQDNLTHISIFKDDLRSEINVVIISGNTLLNINDPKSCVLNELDGAIPDSEGLVDDVVNIANALKQMVNNSK